MLRPLRQPYGAVPGHAQHSADHGRVDPVQLRAHLSTASASNAPWRESSSTADTTRRPSNPSDRSSSPAGTPSAHCHAAACRLHRLPERRQRIIGTPRRLKSSAGIGGARNSWGCNEAKQYLKPVSTIKVGAELRAADDFYLRAGYNWESAPMSKDAFLNLFTSSPSYYYSANTDYLNSLPSTASLADWAIAANTPISIWPISSRSRRATLRLSCAHRNF